MEMNSVSTLRTKTPVREAEDEGEVEPLLNLVLYK